MSSSNGSNGKPTAPAMPATPITRHSDGRCTGCPACVPVADRRNIRMAEAFAVVAYGKVLDDGELAQRHRLFVEAHGLVLPNGRVLTYSDGPHENARNEVKFWDEPEDAADHWGGYLLWPSGQAGRGKLERHEAS